MKIKFNRKKTWLSWSTGKDSAYALQLLSQVNSDYEVVGLFSAVSDHFDRVTMHGVRRELLLKQTEAIGLPLHIVPIPYPCPDEIYAELIRAQLLKAIKEGVTAIAFGDIFLSEVRKYREENLAKLGLKGVFPLWGKGTNFVAKNIISSGISAIIASVNGKLLDGSLAGEEFDDEFISALPSAVDPCGENGEFHTFVYKSPAFAKKIDIKIGSKVMRDGNIYVDIL